LNGNILKMADIQGGAYEAVRAANQGGEVHHMPAAAVSYLSRAEGPAIWMEAVDHHKTASWGRSREAIAYRKSQQALIQQGQFRTAQQMDINDVRLKFGDKYDRAIAQMLRYMDEISIKIIPL
jgi:hypothetical protein